MGKLDGQVQASYQKMLEKDKENEEEPEKAQKGTSIFSPGNKKKTPGKSSTYKTPSRREKELQKFSFIFLIFRRSASRQKYREALQDNARAEQAIAAEGKPTTTLTPVLVELPQTKELDEKMKKLLDVVNLKQNLITGMTSKLGEFVTKFRELRAAIDESKKKIGIPEKPDTIGIDAIEKYKIFSKENIRIAIVLQTETEVWQKNFLSNEASGINVYDALKAVNDMIQREREDFEIYFQKTMNDTLNREKAASEVFLLLLLM